MLLKPRQRTLGNVRAGVPARESPALNTLLVAASDSPPEQRDMTEKLAEVLPNARLVYVRGGHLVDPAGPEVLAFIEEVLGT